MQNLQPFHTFHLPAQAHRIVEATSADQLQQAYQQAQAENLPVLILGQGSNMLFLTDFHGVIILNRLMGITLREDSENHYLHVNGGENWHSLVQWTLNQGIRGLENLALIPGCAGSAPIQNIGAYGVEFKDVCDYVDVLNLTSGETFRLNAEQCEFGYRESIFKHRYQQGYAIVAVGLKLAKNWQPVLKYGSLVEFDPQSVTALQVFEEVCRIRQSKLPNPDEFGNAGSFFKNPVVSTEQFAEIQKQSENLPHFPQPDGSVKLAAGWLIDQCALKGVQIGGAAVHEKQALVLINKAQANGEDVRQLARYVRQSVLAKFGVALQPEVRFIGANGEINSEIAIMTFNEILNTLPSIDHLQGLNIQANDEIIHHIPAMAGKLGSLRVYNTLSEKFNGKLDRASAQQGLLWFAEHTQDAKANPGKHPNIDLLLKVITEDLSYQLLPISN